MLHYPGLVLYTTNYIFFNEYILLYVRLHKAYIYSYITKAHKITVRLITLTGLPRSLLFDYYRCRGQRPFMRDRDMQRIFPPCPTKPLLRGQG